MDNRRKHNFRLHPIVLAIHLGLAGAALADLPPGELPAGGQVVSGQAVIQQQGTRMDIQQATQRAALDWRSFNIGAQAQVNFQQPGADAVALNRVTQGDASVIEGRLTANGQVFLVNPNGVLFAKGARVDVGGIAATTMDIRKEDFESGNYRFTRNGASGAIINQGEIKANGGYVALAAATVLNEGTIQANGGTVALAAGDGVRLEFGDGKLLNIQVDPATVKTLIENKQLIQAQDGRVLMTAAAASRLQGAVINNAGAVEATSLKAEGGVIRLTSSGGDIANTGTLDASGKTGGGTVELAATPTADGNGAGITQAGSLRADAEAGRGGSVQLAADTVELKAGSQTAARGATSGGTIQVGGGKHGAPLTLASGAAAANAKHVNIEAGVELDASATDTGDGGAVVAWSDGDTQFAGTAKANGGPNGGDGGFIETSGHHLSVGPAAKASTAAPNGKTGEWLLDPYNVVVQSAPPADSGGHFDNNGVWVPDAATDTSYIQPATIQSILGTSNVNAQSNVSITTTGDKTLHGDITINDAIAWGSDRTLSLSAFGNLKVNAPITASGDNATLSLSAVGTAPLNDSDLTYQPDYTAFGNLAVNANIQATGSSAKLSLSAYRDLSVNAGITTTGTNASLSLSAFGTTPVPPTRLPPAAPIQAPSPSSFGNLNVNAGFSATGSNASLSLTASANVNVNANITATGDTASLSLMWGTAWVATDLPYSFTVNNGAHIDLTGATPVLTLPTRTQTVSGKTTQIQPLAYTLVRDLAGLQNIANNLSGNYALTNDIDASATLNWNLDPDNPGTFLGFKPIGDSTATGHYFSGNFEGLGHVINNLAINRPRENYVGLFGAVGNPNVVTGSVIQDTLQRVANVGLANANVIGGGSPNEQTGGGVGGLAGFAGAQTRIDRTYVNGHVEGQGYTNNQNVIVTQGNNVGGLVGLGRTGNSSGNGIFNSYTMGTVVGHNQVGGLLGYQLNEQIVQTFSHADVTGNDVVGGLVGHQAAALRSSFSTGQVTGLRDITGATKNQFMYVGGLVGVITGGANLFDSYSLGTVSATFQGTPASPSVLSSANVGGLVGALNYQLQDSRSFSDSGGKIYGAYSTGTVTASLPSDGSTPRVGGLIGSVNNIDLSNGYGMYASFWDVDTSGIPANSGRGNGVGVANYSASQEASFSENSDKGLDHVTMMTNAPFATLPRDATYNTVNWKKWGTQTTVATAQAAGSSTWIIPGDKIQYPYLAWAFPNGVQVVSGSLSDSTGAKISGGLVKAVSDGKALDQAPYLNAAQATYANQPQARTGANGFYYFALNLDSVPAGHALLVYQSAAPQPTGVVRLSGDDAYQQTTPYTRNLLDVNLTQNQLIASSNTAAIGSADLTAAVASLNIADPANLYNLPYTASGADINVKGNASFETKQRPAPILTPQLPIDFTLNGSVTTHDANQTWGGKINLAGNGALVSGNGTITLADSVNGCGGCTFSLNTTSPAGFAQGTNAPFHVYGLELLGAGTPYTIRNADNHIGILAGNTGGVSLFDAEGLTVGRISTTVGLTTSGAVTLETGSGNLGIGNDLDAGANAVTLIAAGDINGTGGKIITTDTQGGLSLSAGGGIGIGGTVRTRTSGGPGLTPLRLASDGNGAAGNISVAEDNTLQTSRVTLGGKGSGTGRAVSLASNAADTLIIDNPIGNAADDLILSAPNSSIVRGTPLEQADIATARNLTLGAGVAIGAAGAPILTAVTEAGANTGAIAATSGTFGTLANGDIWLSNTGAASLTANANGGLVDVENTGGTLTVAAGGVRSNNGSANLRDAAADIILNGTVSGFDAATNGNAVVLSTGARFINNPGGGVTANGGGRWLVYSNNPMADVFGGLASGNNALWGAAYPATPAVGSVSGGNRFLFAYQPTVSFTGANLSKIYGQDYTANVAAQGIGWNDTGYYSGNGAGTAFLQDTLANVFSGAIRSTSDGAPAAATVAGSPYPIVVTQGSLATLNGNAMAFSNGLLTVNPLGVTVIDLSGAKVYDATPTFLSSQLTMAGVIPGDTVNLSGSADVSSANVGHYSSWASSSLALDNTNYTLAGGAVSVDITPRPITLAAGSNAPGTRFYGDAANPAVGYTVGGQGMAGGQDAQTLLGFTVGSIANNATPAGVYNPGTANAYKINGTSVGMHGNYNVTALNDGTLTVDKAPLTVTANPDHKLYDGLPYSGGNGVAYNGFVNNENASALGGTLAYSGSSQGAVNVGNYIITPGGLTAANYAIAFNNGALTIEPLAILLSASPVSKIYDSTVAIVGAPPVVSANQALAVGDSIQQGSFSFAYDTPNVGFGDKTVFAPIPASNVIVRGGVDVSGNYLITGNGTGVYASQVVNTASSILPRDISLMAGSNAPGTRFYGDAANPAVGYTVGGQGMAGGQDAQTLLGFTVGSIANNTTAAGVYNPGTANAYKINGTSTGMHGNYNVTALNDGTLTVDKAPLTVTANPDHKLYDGLPYSGGNGVAYNGFVNNENASVLGGTLAYSGSSQGAVNVGNYAITPGGLTAANYAIAFNNGTLAIDPRDISLTAGSNAPGTRFFGDATNPVVGYTVGGQGMVGGDNAQALLRFTVGSIADSTTPAGIYGPGNLYAYKINGTSIGLHGNYNVTALNDGTLTIDALASPPSPSTPPSPTNPPASTNPPGPGSTPSPVSVASSLLPTATGLGDFLALGVINSPLSFNVAGEIEPKFGERYNYNTSGKHPLLKRILSALTQRGFRLSILKHDTDSAIETRSLGVEPVEITAPTRPGM